MTAGIVRFAQYRAFEAQRQDASNAMMGLLAGAQLASHLLQLTEGSDTLLPDVFPRVAHIRRFNLRTEAALSILQSADTHLGAMSVPYALALHEDFLKTCIDLLARNGTAPASASRGALVVLHDAIEAATGKTFDVDSITQLDTLRLMLNATIHSGGRAHQPLIDKVASWSPTAEAAWVRITKKSLAGIAVGDRVQFGHPELILSLAVTKSLARQANVILRDSLGRGLWAELVIEDVLDEEGGHLNQHQLERKAAGKARRHYNSLKLTAGELASAMRVVRARR
ncbi:hypothetical protein GCM10029976_080220 [Kribbella albertanoniae]|uniref:Uncharacterized protein n=1 Tax=Kribbella albertanoniae TaxID=1266829 RepID=A0A4V2XQ99_9ACTN|nr:hypothetical protein [Kribbella albertanoniae]TDC25125.1 hypothetical protein E1261_24820 [Kribbella albertanoniae]